MEPEEKPTPASTGAAFGSRVADFATGQKAGGGRYTLIKFLGKGGMGIVWLARDEQLQDEVALKFLPAEIHHDVEALDDMRRETLKSRKLSHPNIIRIHDLHVVPEEAPFISMEYIAGAPLNVLKAKQPQRFFAWEYLKPIIKQLCDALDYAHSEKVIHRDLKPANMMLDHRGRLKLADFGIAAVMSESMSRVSLKHSTSGTLVYMSPQQMNGQKPEPSDDIYALGATLYELLTSKPPFYQGDMHALINQVQNIEPKALADRLVDLELTNEIPPDVSAVVMACLSKDPAQRPRSAAAIAEWIGLKTSTETMPSVLASQVFEQPPSPPGPAAVISPATPQRELADEEDAVEPAPAGAKKSGLWIGLGMAAVLVALGLGGFLMSTKNNGKKSDDSKTVASPSQQNDYGLSFKDGGRVTMDSLLINLGKPLTIEGYVTPSALNGYQIPLLAFDLINLLIDGKQWTARVFTSQGIDHLISDVAAVSDRRTHVALVVDGQQIRLYVDGKQATIPPRSAGLLVTNNVPFWLGYGFTGSVDEVRVSKTIRYTKEFTPQTRFTPDSDTLGLYHCDEGTGNELKDSSGNGHHGKITDAKWVKSDGSAIGSVPAPKNGSKSAAPATPSPTPKQTLDPMKASNTASTVVDLGGGVSMELALIRPGSFTMGSDSGSGNEKPVHKVTLTRPFYMGKFEVTQEQWEKVMGNNPSNFKGPKLPVENVSWNDCQSFLAKLQEKTGRKFALPTEAQWEYACRAGTTTRYSFGDSDTTLAEHGWFNSNSGNTTHSVGEKKPNPWGLYDMHGNVWEWCADWFADAYPSGEATDPQGPTSGSYRVLRGGAWVNNAVNLRSSYRRATSPDYRYFNIGLRCVMGEAAP